MEPVLPPTGGCLKHLLRYEICTLGINFYNLPCGGKNCVLLLYSQVSMVILILKLKLHVF